MTKWNLTEIFFWCEEASGIRDGRERSQGSGPSPRERLLKSIGEINISKEEIAFYQNVSTYLYDEMRERYFLNIHIEKHQTLLLEHKKKGYRIPNPMVSKALSVFLRIFWPLADITVIHYALQELRVPEEFLYPLSLALPTVFIFITHTLGQMNRQKDSFKSEGAIRRGFRLLFYFHVLSAGVISLALLRAQAAPLLSWDFLIFPGMHCLILGGSYFLGFASHDPDAELERIWKQLTTQERTIRKGFKKWGKPASKVRKLVSTTRARIGRIKDEVMAWIDEYRYGMDRGNPNASFFDSSINDLPDPQFRERDLETEVPFPWNGNKPNQLFHQTNIKEKHHEQDDPTYAHPNGSHSNAFRDGLGI